MKQHFHALLFALRHIGLLGWVGAMLALSSFAYAAIYVPQQQAQLESAQDEILRLQKRRKAIEMTRKIAVDANVPTRAATELPTVKMTPEALLNLDRIARKNKLQLIRNTNSYVERVAPVRAAPAAGKPPAELPVQAPVVEVRIAVPVSGNYRSIRAFIAQALEDRSTLALDGMSLNREAIEQGAIQAQLRFTLFARRD